MKMVLFAGVWNWLRLILFAVTSLLLFRNVAIKKQKRQCIALHRKGNYHLLMWSGLWVKQFCRFLMANGFLNSHSDKYFRTKTVYECKMKIEEYSQHGFIDFAQKYVFFNHSNLQGFQNKKSQEIFFFKIMNEIIKRYWPYKTWLHI